eukprot:CAMPEP_0204288088 /NCGR_PEP_ID=MMETSP0468-20130131/56025_1 /ASSEMBLY_ACC=CAM_ASM_000383 /TAXON_ID=2969 /ORGANISM="Oxyrrhis marina" /LENGTH=89 /DNA_ID=CAMNT_0051266147 /DNA_START=644 /DNA_END=913 /DNA_ORIENTATION=+
MQIRNSPWWAAPPLIKGLSPSSGVATVQHDCESALKSHRKQLVLEIEPLEMSSLGSYSDGPIDLASVTGRKHQLVVPWPCQKPSQRMAL